MQKIDLHVFNGMNNVSGRVSETTATPIFLQDAISLYTGTLQQRPGQQKLLDLINANNIWKDKNGTVFLISDDKLNILDIPNKTVIPIFDTEINFSYKVYYTEINDVIYCGNKHWLTAIESKESRPIGQSLLDLHGLDWKNTPNGKVLYLENSAGEETIVPHPGEFAHPPKPVDLLTQGFGRLLGSRGSKVFYSYPILVEWWEDTTNFLDVDEDVTMIAFVSNGMYIGTTDSIIFCSGTDVTKTSLNTVSYLGAIKNAVVKAPKSLDLPKDTPIFMNTEGNIVACLPGGQLQDITKDKLIVQPPSISDTGVIQIDGIDTLLFKIKEV